MKYPLIFTLLLLVGCSGMNEQNRSTASLQEMSSLVDLVNPLVGSASSHALSNGNTYPAMALPWGMNFWTPQTGKMGDGWAYTYDPVNLLFVNDISYFGIKLIFILSTLEYIR